MTHILNEFSNRKHYIDMFMHPNQSEIHDVLQLICIEIPS